MNYNCNSRAFNLSPYCQLDVEMPGRNPGDQAGISRKKHSEGKNIEIVLFVFYNGDE